MAKKKQIPEFEPFEMPNFDRAEVLRGQVRDAVLAKLRSLEKPFAQLSESEQRTMTQQVDLFARTMLVDVVDCVAAHGFAVIRGNMEQAVVKDGVKIVIKAMVNDDDMASLVHAVKKNVAIVVADVDAFLGEKGPARIDPDQKELPVTTAAAVAQDKGVTPPAQAALPVEPPTEPEAPQPLMTPRQFPTSGKFDMPVYLGAEYVGHTSVDAENLGAFVKLGLLKVGILKPDNPDHFEDTLECEVLPHGAVLPVGTMRSWLGRIHRLVLDDGGSPPAPDEVADQSRELVDADADDIMG